MNTNDVKLTLCSDDLTLLVKLAYTGFTVFNEVDDTDRARREMLIDRILEASYNAGATEGKRHIKELNGYFFDDDTEAGILAEYCDFVETSFWNELPVRLALRDLIETEGRDKIEKMTEGETAIAVEKYEKKYRTEFAANGIANLKMRI